MAARAMGSATVSFGLVSIPVKLYAATETAAAVSFHMLHAKCNTRLKQQYVCPKCEVVVSRDDTIKGYEFAKGQYVTFTPEELKALDAEATQAVEITEFVPIAKIDPLYYDRPYFLGPDKGGDKAYRLLARVMEDSGRAALATYQARGKQYLVLLRPLENGIVMQQLHYADELRSISEVPIAELPLKDTEIKLARQLVDQITTEEFHPEAYEDEVRKRVQERIQQKVEGQEIAVEPAAAGKGQIIDLMEALKSSLEGGGRAAARATRGPKERKPAKTASRGTRPARKKTSSSG